MLALLLAAQLSGNAAPGYLYRATLLQAAPGKILEVVEMWRSGWPGLRGSGDEPPVAMRHSQGDRWDLLLIFPMASFEAYFAGERVARRRKAQDADRPRLDRLREDVAWQEDVFVDGPPLEALRKAFDGAGFFHVEMFETLPGRGRDLHREREMENTYAKVVGQPENLIFTRVSGAPWDLFTVGAYRDLKHYAESSDVPEAKAAEAARAAGFEDAKHIGPYLRTLIALHHDTLAVAMK